MNSAQLLSRLYEKGAKVTLDRDRILVTAPQGALDDDLWAELSARKDQLRHWLGCLETDQRPELALRRIGDQRPAQLPLSYAQQRLWFIDRFEGSSVEYNMPQALRLRG